MRAREAPAGLAQHETPLIGRGADAFDPRHRAQFQEFKHPVPVIRWPVNQRQREKIPPRRPALLAQIARRTPQRRRDLRVESAQRAEAGRERDVGEFEIRLGDQPLGEKNPPCPRQSDGRGPGVAAHQPP